MIDFYSFLAAYLAIINILSFLMFGYDKFKAKRDGWRIPERRFLVLGLLGGAIGLYLGMRIFRHKTRHRLFVFGIPLLMTLNLIIIYYLIRDLLT
ncbi:MAG: hypothetical protein APF84_19390 [Gracilibacter sp. BRH_c7a]|nr:MAG: hypothetical protein APF84_19390 [Gracilibacter sp. BRH_c7a]